MQVSQLTFTHYMVKLSARPQYEKLSTNENPPIFFNCLPFREPKKFMNTKCKIKFLHSELLMVDISLNCSSRRSSLTSPCLGSLHSLELKLSVCFNFCKTLIPERQSYHSPDPQQVVDLLHKKILHLHQHHTLQRTSQFPCQKSCILNNK